MRWHINMQVLQEERGPCSTLADGELSSTIAGRWLNVTSSWWNSSDASVLYSLAHPIVHFKVFKPFPRPSLLLSLYPHTVLLHLTSVILLLFLLFSFQMHNKYSSSLRQFLPQYLLIINLSCVTCLSLLTTPPDVAQGMSFAFPLFVCLLLFLIPHRFGVIFFWISLSCSHSKC